MNFETFKNEVNLILAIDHGSRAGNAFVLTLFDQHEEVLCIPWMMYCYSYIIHKYDNKTKLPAKEVHELVTTTGYFRYIYNDLDETTSAEVSKWGGDPEANVDRAKVREIFDQLILKNHEVERKDVVVAMLYSYAIAQNRDLSKIKYLMLADAISMRHEDPISGYSGKIIDIAEVDFPTFWLVSLNRDPRAQFASCRHQFINQNGNNLGLRPINIFKRFYELISLRLNPDNFAFLYWVCYQRQTYQTIKRHLAVKGRNTVCFINEDINLNFIPTMDKYSKVLGISFFEGWREKDYIPTSVGSSWGGTGAYNSRYQKKKTGPLQNDSDKDSKKSIGPNSIVTERWKKRLPAHEKRLLTFLFREEIEDHFPASHYSEVLNENNAFKYLLKPTLGEIPAISWVFSGEKGIWTIIERFFYLLALPIFYPLVRISLLRAVRKENN